MEYYTHNFLTPLLKGMQLKIYTIRKLYKAMLFSINVNIDHSITNDKSSLILIQFKPKAVLKYIFFPAQERETF